VEPMNPTALGRLFRTVLESALRSHGIACEVIVDKQIAARAVAGLSRRDTEIKKVVAGFGKTLCGPWRADERTQPRRPGSRSHFATDAAGCPPAAGF